MKSSARDRFVHTVAKGLIVFGVATLLLGSFNSPRWARASDEGDAACTNGVGAPEGQKCCGGEPIPEANCCPE